MVPELLAVAAAYLVGSIPFGLLLAKSAGIDVRHAGSGNIGATNVGRLAGKKLGLLTLAADILKGFVPAAVAAFFFQNSQSPAILPALCGLAAFLGHLYPLWLAFKGGKGVATALGVFAFLSPPATLICLAVFLASIRLSRYVSLSSMLACATAPVALFFLDAPPVQQLLGLVIALLVCYRHQDNIRRLLRGEESRTGGGKP